MVKQPSASSTVELAFLLRDCGDKYALHAGRKVHDRIIQASLEDGGHLGSIIVQMYGKCGAVEDACASFFSLHERTLSLWNFMIDVSAQHGQPAHSFHLFDQMLQESVAPDDETYINIISACSTSTLVADAVRMHAREPHGNVALQTTITSMYSKCGRPVDAMTVFDIMAERDVVAWNAMLAARVMHGDDHSAFLCFQQMQIEGHLVDKYTCVTMLSACANQGGLILGKQIHARSLESEFKSNRVLALALIKAYGKCGAIEDASVVFDGTQGRDIVLWNAMITVYTQNGHGQEAFELFNQMQQEALMPDKVAYLSALSGCVSQLAILQGMQLHASIACSIWKSDTTLITNLIQLYGKSDKAMDVWLLFENMAEQDVAAWNALISAFGQHAQTHEIFQLLNNMQIQNVVPSKVTIVIACSKVETLLIGKQIHVYAVSKRLTSDILVGNALISMYSKCGCLDEARIIFDGMATTDAVSWNILISAYAEKGFVEEAFHAFVQTFQHVVPDAVTYMNILSACSDLLKFGGSCRDEAEISVAALLYHSIVCSRHESDATISNLLIKLYSKCGSLNDAICIFDQMSDRNIVSWTVMVATYVEQGHLKEAFQLFNYIQEEGIILDKVTILTIVDACGDTTSSDQGKEIYINLTVCGINFDADLATAFIIMYKKCDALCDARWIFDWLPERDVVSWTAMITAYIDHGHTKESFLLFDRMMLEGVIPDRIALVSLLEACEIEASLLEVKKLDARSQESQTGMVDLFLTALINIYGKCGSLNDAQATFENVSCPSLPIWNSILSVYAQFGLGREALCIMHEMGKHKMTADSYTFFNVLCACCRDGSVNEGFWCLSSLWNHGIKPVVDHFDCMIDLLGRAGRLDEADVLVNAMPFEPTVFSWAAFLSGCKIQVDVVRGEYAGNCLFELDPADSASYVSVINVYATAGA